MCLYPKLIDNPKYKSNAKNKGVVPPCLDERCKFVPIGCTNCIECRKQKARAWNVRLQEDIKTNKNGKFITLTFSNESIKKLTEYQKKWTQTGSKAKYVHKIAELDPMDQDNEIATVAMRLFNERWRKRFGKALRHWTVTELGHNGTENIHIHGIIWVNDKYEWKTGRGKKRKTEIISGVNAIQKTWEYGFVWKGKTICGININYVNAQTVNYITKYVHKVDMKHKYYKSKVLTSPGIGNNYTKTFNAKTNKFKGTKTEETYTTGTGHKIALPIYWRNKIYNDEEREKLWIIRLDKEERWICGEKVDISKNYDEYNKTVKWHRERNKKLGYGNDEKNWNRIVYERERRRIMQITRIKNAA